jgi:hypothetical protein
MSVVSIIGMHRSGTSCVTGSLQSAGLFAGDVVESAPFNKKGNRENLEIRSLNEEVLSYNSGNWKNPPERIIWTKEHTEKRDHIISRFYQKEKAWLFKDPRTTLTLRFWGEGIQDLILVGVFRQPIAVAKSLENRGKIPVSESIRIWCIYNTRILETAKKQELPIISFDSSQSSFIQQIERTVEWLAVKLKNKTELKTENCCNFYENGLIHYGSCSKVEKVIDSLHMLLEQDKELARRASKIYLELSKMVGVPKF